MAALSDGCEAGQGKCALKADLSLSLPLSLSAHLLKGEGAQVSHSVQEPLGGSWGRQDQKEAVMCGVVTALTFVLRDSYNGRIWQHAAVLQSPYVKNESMQSFQQNPPAACNSAGLFQGLESHSSSAQTALVTPSNASQRCDCHTLSGGLCSQSFVLLKDLKCSCCCRISSRLSSSFNFHFSPIHDLFFIQTEFITVYRPLHAICDATVHNISPK